MLGLFSSFAVAQEDPDSPPPRYGARDVVVLRLVDRTIDEEVANTVEERITNYVQLGVRNVILEFATTSGDIDACRRISQFLLDLDGVITIGLVPKNRTAKGAPALCVLSCRYLYMGVNSAVGGADGERLAERELAGRSPADLEKLFADAARNACRTNGYPEPIGRGMVEEITVLEIRPPIDGNAIITEAALLQYLEKNPQKRRNQFKEKVLLTRNDLVFSETALYDAGIASNADEIPDVCQSRDLKSPIIAEGLDPRREIFGPEVSEDVAKFLQHGFVLFMLVVLGIVCVALEFLIVGSVIPGAIGLLSFGLFFVGGYMNGNVGWVEVTLFAVAGILVACELFVIPGFGVAGVLGLAALFASLVLSLQPVQEFSQEQFATDSIVVMGGMATAMVLLFFVIRALPNHRLARGIVSDSTLDSETTIPGLAERTFDSFLGHQGTISSPCRPGGRILLDDPVRELDVVTEGSFLDRGRRAEIIQIEGNRIVVKATDDDTYEPAAPPAAPRGQSVIASHDPQYLSPRGSDPREGDESDESQRDGASG